MRQKRSFKIMGIIKALRCCQNLYQVVVMPIPWGFTLGWPWPFLWRSNLFLMLLYGWKLIEHCMLLYFQVCSNSAYPQHSGERYRTSGPLGFFGGVYCIHVRLSVFPSATFWFFPYYLEQTMTEFHQTLQTHCYPQDRALGKGVFAYFEQRKSRNKQWFWFFCLTFKQGNFKISNFFKIFA